MCIYLWRVSCHVHTVRIGTSIAKLNTSDTARFPCLCFSLSLSLSLSLSSSLSLPLNAGRQLISGLSAQWRAFTVAAVLSKKKGAKINKTNAYYLLTPAEVLEMKRQQQRMLLWPDILPQSHQQHQPSQLKGLSPPLTWPEVHILQQLEARGVSREGTASCAGSVILWSESQRTGSHRKSQQCRNT